MAHAVLASVLFLSVVSALIDLSMLWTRFSSGDPVAGDPEGVGAAYSLSCLRKRGRVQKSMGHKVPWKIVMLICHPVTSQRSFPAERSNFISL